LGQAAIVDDEADEHRREGRRQRVDLSPERRARLVRADVPRHAVDGGQAEADQRQNGRQERPVEMRQQAAVDDHGRWSPSARAIVPAGDSMTGAGGGGGDAVPGSTGSGRPSRLAKNVSMTWRAIGVAAPLVCPCSAKTTPAICGLSRGAKKTNHPWSRTSRPRLAASARFCSEMLAWAVPVLPATSRPTICARRPVPP